MPKRRKVYSRRDFALDTIATLETLEKKRAELRYHGRGWWILNNALVHVSDLFWEVTEEWGLKTPQCRKVPLRTRARREASA